MYRSITRISLLAVTLLLLGSAAFGAAIDASSVPAKPTFSRDVAPIFYAKCVSCHQPNDIAPMSLRTFEEVRPWAKSIGRYVANREMPPWDADPGYGPFLNDRSLTDSEISTIVRWAKKGAPEGDASDLPEIPLAKPAGWKLGEPDYIIELQATEVPAEGPDMFRNMVHETGFGEDKWITAVEVLPGNREVVHHVLLWQAAKGGGNPESLIGGWAAGAQPEELQEGTGRLLKKGHPLIGDVHYHPVGIETTDVTRIGLHFAKNIDKELVNQWIINQEFEIPAGDSNHEVRSTFTFAQDSHILNVTPHMHYRGKDFTYTATYPDGRQEVFFKTSTYDFNWQTTYAFEEPLAMPAGTRVDCVAHFDNSKRNPANPDHTKNVRFGNESFDEMMIGFVDYVVDEGVSPLPLPSPVEQKLRELAEQFPGEVWRFEMPNADGGTDLNALHIPHEGDGGWYVSFANIVGKAPITDIQWNGTTEMTASMTPPGQATMQLEGTIDIASKTLAMKITNADGSGGTVEGTLAE